MDEETAARFVTSLVKSIQALCNGYIDFSSSIEVIGHIHLNIDRNSKFNYVLTEEVNKSPTEDATLFSSHSYHSKPPPGIAANAPNSASKPNRRKSHQVPRVDSSDSDSLILSGFSKDKSQSDSPLLISSVRSGAEVSADFLQPAPTHTDSSSDRRRKSNPSVLKAESPAAKRHRTNDFDKIEIKAEPPEESLPVCFGPAGGDEEQGGIETPDFSSVVMESLDRVGKAEGSQLMGAGSTSQRQQDQQLPFPVMLHQAHTSNTGASPAIFAGPGPSSESQPSVSGEIIAGRRVRKPTTKAIMVQTPYDCASKTSSKKKQPARLVVMTKGAKTSSVVSPASTPRVLKPVAERRGRVYKASGYREYTDEDVQEAIELIHGGVSVIDAALKYGIPRATLFNRSRDGCKTHSGRCSEVFARTHTGIPNAKKREGHRLYTPEAVEKAIEAIHNGMPVIDASILYRIPRASLFIRSSKGCPSHPGRCSTVFSDGRLRRTRVPKNKYQSLHKQAKAVLANRSGDDSDRWPIPEGVPVVNPATGEVLAFKKVSTDNANTVTIKTEHVVEESATQESSTAEPAESSTAAPAESATAAPVDSGVRPVQLMAVNPQGISHSSGGFQLHGPIKLILKMEPQSDTE